MQRQKNARIHFPYKIGSWWPIIFVPYSLGMRDSSMQVIPIPLLVCWTSLSPLVKENWKLDYKQSIVVDYN